MKIPKGVVVAAFFLCSGEMLSAQEDSTGQKRDTVSHRMAETPDDLLDQLQRHRNNLARFGDAIIYTWTSPLRWKKKDWITAGGTVAATTLLFLADKPVDKFWQHNQSGFMHGIERSGYHYGKPYAAFIVTGGFYGVGLIIKSDWAKETALILGSTYLSSGAVQTLMKTAFGRARPGTDVGNMRFEPFSKDAGYHSFPSGHIQVAMATAAVLAGRVNSPVLKTLFYATASTTMLSRLYSHSHWTSDLFFGGAVSYFMARTNLKRWAMTKPGTEVFPQLIKHQHRLSWNLEPTENGLGIVGRFH